jgi:hypothetical protein
MMSRSTTHSYLGMQLTLQQNKVNADMPYFINYTIDEFKVKLKMEQLKTRATPGKKIILL